MKILLALLIASSSCLVFAKDKATGKSSGKNVQYRKTQEVSFDGADVDGEVRSPDGAFVNPQKGVKFMPLYQVEKRFDKSIKESTEFVR